MATRDIHISRTIDMLFGSYITSKDSPVEAIAKDFQQLIDEINSAGSRYRDILTKNTPAIYVVDCEDVARTIQAELSSKKTTRVFGSGELTASLGGTARLKEFIKPDGFDSINAVVNEPGFVADLADFLYKSFSSGGSVLKRNSKTTQGLFGVQVETSYEPSGTYKAIPEGTLTDLYTKVQGHYIKYRASVAEEMRGSRNYNKIQSHGVKLGRDLSDTLKNISNFLVTDAKKHIVLPNSKTVVVSGASFDSLVTAVNRVLDNAFKYFMYNKNVELLNYFKTYEDRTDKDKKFFSIGYLINAGHTSVSAMLSGGKRVMGVNMPSAQQAQVPMTKQMASSLEDDLASIYANIDYDVKFKNSYRNAKVLLELNFAFVITMPSALNTKSLNVLEQQVIKKYTKDIEKSLQQFASSKKVLSIAAEYLPISNASPNLITNITKDILSILKGEKRAPADSRFSLSGSNSLQKPIKKQKIAPKTRVTKSKKLAPTSATTVRITSLDSKTTNLVSLQNLINRQLQDVISANMGDGNSRNILNYRTGRLAASAKVERLSESRAGMITAFYSYMKNPYATFSDGGLQQNPRSRDPKLLISKSIREIAATQVANQLRAVNV